MPFVIQSQKLNPNSSADFVIQGQVTQYLAGVSSFRFTYGKTDHKVQQLGLNVTSQLLAGTSQSTVRVTANGTLSDASGNTIEGAYIMVSVLAWTGIANPDLTLSSAYSFPSSSQSSNIGLPGTQLTLLNASLTGFNLNYGADDYHVASVMAQVSPGQNGNQGFVSGQSAMQDSSGDQAQNPTVSGNLLASNSTNPGFVVTPYTNQYADQCEIPIGVALQGAMVLLTGFQVQFPDGDDHHVLEIGAGPDSCQLKAGDPTTVVTSGVWAWMYDEDGNWQDNSKSSASIIVVGLPA